MSLRTIQGKKMGKCLLFKKPDYWIRFVKLLLILS
jgi:hypothetical protein